MMKQSTLTILFCLALCSLQAQDAKQKLGFIPYSDPSADNYGYREMAYDYLFEAATRIFINTQRFEILDRSKFDVLKLEKNITKGDDFINSEIVAQGNALAADVLVVAKVTALSVIESEAKDGEEDEVGWSAFFTVEFKQLDVETTKALNAVQLVGEHKDGGSTLSLINANSPEQAISKAVTKIEKDLREWINTNFPIYMEVLDRDDANQVIYALGGKDIGLSQADKMCIRRIRKLSSGHIVEETIAELKFTKSDGVGEATTKFELRSKKEWEQVVQALTEHPEEVFIMKCVNQGILDNILSN